MSSGGPLNVNNTAEQVKIVYFLGKSVTPILKVTEIGYGASVYNLQ